MTEIIKEKKWCAKCGIDHDFVKCNICKENVGFPLMCDFRICTCMECTECGDRWYWMQDGSRYACLKNHDSSKYIRVLPKINICNYTYNCNICGDHKIIYDRFNLSKNHILTKEDISKYTYPTMKV